MDATKHGGVLSKRKTLIQAMVHIMHNKNDKFTDDEGNILQRNHISFEIVDANGNKVPWASSILWDKIED